MTESATTSPSSTPETESPATEARRVAERLLHGKLADPLNEVLLDHLLDAYRGADWPVVRAAVEALARRAEAARREDLRIATAPAGRAWRGIYSTRRPREPARPYRTLLTSIDPLVASCDCPDFRSNSLGVCKHVLAVLHHLARRPRTFNAARAESFPAVTGARLSWQPVKPLFGRGDWLDRVSIEAVDGRPAAGPFAALHRRFALAVDGRLLPKDSFRDDPRQRLGLVTKLAEAMTVSSRGLPSDPALAPLLADEQRRLAAVVALQRRATALDRGLTGLGRTLYDYQREGVAAFLGRGRLLLADDMGLGKTVQAIASCVALWRAGMVRRGLVSSRASNESAPAPNSAASVVAS